MLAWVTVPVFWAHLVSGFTLVALVGPHLYTRRRPPLRGVPARRRLAYAAVPCRGGRDGGNRAAAVGRDSPAVRLAWRYQLPGAGAWGGERVVGSARSSSADSTATPRGATREERVMSVELFDTSSLAPGRPGSRRVLPGPASDGRWEHRKLGTRL
jgi:hypothetical protein